jgi:hypothetical protein
MAMLIPVKGKIIDLVPVDGHHQFHYEELRALLGMDVPIWYSQATRQKEFPNNPELRALFESMLGIPDPPDFKPAPSGIFEMYGPVYVHVPWNYSLGKFPLNYQIAKATHMVFCGPVIVADEAEIADLVEYSSHKWWRGYPYYDPDWRHKTRLE